MTYTKAFTHQIKQQQMFIKHVWPTPSLQESTCNMCNDKVNPCSYAVYTTDELLIINHLVNKSWCKSYEWPGHLTWKDTWVIHSPWQTFLPNMTTEGWMIHELLIENQSRCNNTEWPWSFTYKEIGVIHLATKYEDCRLNNRWVIDRKPFMM